MFSSAFHKNVVHYEKREKKSYLIQSIGSYMDLRSDNFMGSVGGADQIEIRVKIISLDCYSTRPKM